MDPAPTCWIVTDGAAGNVKQCEALAEAIGASAETLSLTLRQPWARLVPYWRALGTLGIAGELADRLHGPWPELRVTYYWRFLETRDEYFPYSEKVPPPQGLWQIYGLDLPDDVLQKVYSQNAIRLMPRLQDSLRPTAAT